MIAAIYARSPGRGLLLAGMLLTGLLVAPSGSLYDTHGRRQGYVWESRPGQYDLYDSHSRWLGYGG